VLGREFSGAARRVEYTIAAPVAGIAAASVSAPADLSCGLGGANLDGIVQQARLRSSFIYLANAVGDLSGHWAALGLVLAPLVLVASLCLLPDALNLQYRVAYTFESGLHSVSTDVRDIGGVSAEHLTATPVQEPYRPETVTPREPYPGWLTGGLHAVFALLTLIVNLVVLCALARVHARTKAGSIVAEAVEVYRRSTHLLPGFLWIALLQVLATLVGFVLLVVPGLLVLIWLYFAQYALVFDDRHSWSALLHSRDLMRKRFFKVAVRIVVFLAVWTGYNSWTSGAFIGASVLLGPVAAITGFVWVTVFSLDLLAVSVAYVTTAFFLAAGVRLYLDLKEIASERAAVVTDHPAVEPATAPLSGVGA
jgi:hypothetical protein